MGERRFQASNHSFEKNVTVLHGRCSIGAAGAVTNIQGEGFSEITKESGTGNYSFKLDDKYHKLLSCKVEILSATTAVANSEITSLTADTNIQAGTAVTFTCYDYAGAGVNPANPSIMNIKVVLRNSSLKSKGE